LSGSCRTSPPITSLDIPDRSGYAILAPVSSRAWIAFATVSVLWGIPGPGAIAALLLILAGSWLSTDGRLPPGLVGVFRRRPRPIRSTS
jgi:hypothetical protein